VQGGSVCVVALLEVVVLQQLFVLQVAVLGLDGIELLTEGEVVLVALLDFENLSLELGDEQVLLVAGEVNAIVVLQIAEVKIRRSWQRKHERFRYTYS